MTSSTEKMKFPRLNHIAIAVNDQEKLLRVFELLELAHSGKELVADQGVITHFLQGAAGAQLPQIELLEPVDTEGVIAKYLTKRGPGIHHLCIEVLSCEETCKTLSAGGIRLIYDVPRNGAHGMKINFIHPEATGGILIEVSSAHT